ncbi:uncharacterized protein LOC111894206 [Lactuca sativa]|uniref:uncharacterized protein LOC111894206 n=1 Tax=Lactuca sativa TaxID=4236 RepID=UPI000CD96530|nr:uncharacterized protein LOC111894206 [Lactuca sativa]
MASSSNLNAIKEFIWFNLKIENHLIYKMGLELQNPIKTLANLNIFIYDPLISEILQWKSGVKTQTFSILYEFFQLRYDARDRREFTTLQKCAAAIRLMAMGESPDTMDDYMRMSERTAIESLYTLSRGVVEAFGDVYLQKPSSHALQELYVLHEERHGFPGMIGSIYCTHWKWKNCPVAWKGKYASGHHGSSSLVLEYSTFVKAFRHPVEEQNKFFKRRQEGACKDVERAFGVLKVKWHIVEHAARPLDLETLRYIMYACIIMHNMVVEDKGRNIAHYILTEPRHVQFQPGTTDYLHRVVDIQDANKHRQLREDLADYIFYGNNNDNE